MTKFWEWKVKNILNKETGEEMKERVLVLNGTIAEESWFGDEVTPDVFRNELMGSKGKVTIWINSPGGDCIAAAQIYNMLMEYKDEVIVKIDGLAASAASVIAMAGSKVYMSPVSMLMIHNPSTVAIGNKEDMGKAIEMLDAVKESIMNAYEVKTMLRRNKISELMDKETWMDAKKAIELGFCDEMLKRDETDNELKDTKSQMFQKQVIESNLTNKLKEKYLIKKPEPENIESGTNAKDLLERLDMIKKFI